MIVLQANERNATAQLTGRLTSGSVGIPVTVILSDDYKDLAVTLCFRAGDARADVPYKPGDTVTVPAQCLRQANLTLAIGVRAESSDGTEVIPTIYATVGMIEKGARYSGINPEPPAPSWAAQVQTWANESRDAAVSAKDYAEDVHEWVSTQERITSLNSTELVVTGKSVEALGNPVYVSDVTPYSAYGITETGWYVFARITGRSGEQVTAATSVTGAAGYIATVGESHVDLAVKFGVNALAQKVVIAWGASTDVIVFKATDLAINNLDYRVTFYVYDIADFATWEYKVATGTYADLVGYYTLEGDEYTQIEVTTGDTVPNYYVQVVSYALTTDETYQSGTTYYTYDGTAYTVAEVTTGEAVTANTYYVQTTTYELVEGGSTFEAGVTYYTYNGTTYTAVETVTTGDTVPDNVYQHSKVTFEGMTRNITYRCNTTIDCPVVFVLPEVEDDGHGCWFEIRFRHAGAYSSTLQVPEGVKVATEHTQAETKGINMVDLHFSDVAGAKVWRFMNTHSSIPA